MTGDDSVLSVAGPSRGGGAGDNRVIPRSRRTSSAGAAWCCRRRRHQRGHGMVRDRTRDVDLGVRRAGLLGLGIAGVLMKSLRGKQDLRVT